MSTQRWRRRSCSKMGAIAVALSVAVIATGPLPPFANASGTIPSVRLVTGADKVTLKRPEGRRAYLDLSTYVASVGGAFEIWSARPDYDHPVQMWQVVRQNGAITKFLLPTSAGQDRLELDRFLHVTVKDDAGAVMMDRYQGYCPGSGELARLSVEGPAIPTYPQFCGGNPFTLGAVWGIDEGWASNAFGWYGAGGSRVLTVTTPPPSPSHPSIRTSSVWRPPTRRSASRSAQDREARLLRPLLPRRR